MKLKIKEFLKLYFGVYLVVIPTDSTIVDEWRNLLQLEDPSTSLGMT